MLGDQPLPMTSSVWNLASGQGGRIADGLGQALLLPNDMQYLVEGSDKAVSLSLSGIPGKFQTFPFFTYLSTISISASSLVSKRKIFFVPFFFSFLNCLDRLPS